MKTNNKCEYTFKNVLMHYHISLLSLFEEKYQSINLQYTFYLQSWAYFYTLLGRWHFVFYQIVLNNISPFEDWGVF